MMVEEENKGWAYHISVLLLAVAVLATVTLLDFGIWCGIVALCWYSMHAGGLVFTAMTLRGLLGLTLAVWVGVFIVKLTFVRPLVNKGKE